ncbi:helix-turn-helix DNA binding protein [Mycobacterium phage Mask]|nr:helix-turn-helix DNA binding protein [Mycobacterium phage Sejanus]UVT31608.1 helix-turn-helix DNA binding protein [Mycobacterium phage Mask]
MRAITVRQPWAWQIINQRKNIENRTRNIAGKYRGPVAIHAALKPDQEALARLPMHAPEWVTALRVFDYGVILGVVDLVDVHEAMGSFCPQSCRPWGESAGVWHLVLANPRPIPLNQQPRVRGALGLWTLPEDVAAHVEVLTRG